MLVAKDEIEIVYVNSYYDWPLAGVCKYRGKVHEFRRVFDESLGDYTETLEIIALGRWERFRKWRRRTLFGICVGWHCHYKDGKRVPSRLRPRYPRWFFQRLQNTYFKLSKLRTSA